MQTYRGRKALLSLSSSPTHHLDVDLKRRELQSLGQRMSLHECDINTSPGLALRNPLMYQHSV